jgi:hypothetical protein
MYTLIALFDIDLSLILFLHNTPRTAHDTIMKEVGNQYMGQTTYITKELAKEENAVPSIYSMNPLRYLLTLCTFGNLRSPKGRAGTCFACFFFTPSLLHTSTLPRQAQVFNANEQTVVH